MEKTFLRGNRPGTRRFLADHAALMMIGNGDDPLVREVDKGCNQTGIIVFESEKISRLGGRKGCIWCL
jgi:hypothetical protein